MDAWGAQNASFGNLWKATAEINESLYPHVQWSRDYRTDSGGPGQWRGLCGSHYEKEVRVDAKVYTYVVGMKYPMPGICGGKPGEPNKMVIRYGSDDPFVVKHTADWVPIAGRRARHVRLRRRRRLGRPARPRSAGRARRRARRVRERRGRRARLRRRAHRHRSTTSRSPSTTTPRSTCAPNASETTSSGDASMSGATGYRVGIDVGGTFTDLICVTPDGEVVLDKTPTTLDDQSTGVMNGLGQLAERFGAAARRPLPRARHRRPRHHHRRQHDDRDERRAHRPARHRGPPRRDRDAPGPQGGDLGPVLPRAAADRPAPGPHPDPRAHRLRGRGRCSRSTRTRCAPACGGCRQLGVQLDRGHVPVLVREPGARATRRRDHPRGVPRRRARLAVARGDGRAARSSSACRPRS